jgi:catechol 2,3-dioxygenase-like lactoylglutathione lyase family enzyme
MPAPTIDELTVADDPAGWAALGFDVAGDGCQIGTVRLRFIGCAGNGAALAGPPGASDAPAPAATAKGIAGWSLRDATSAELDGLPTTLSERPSPAPAPPQPNGVLAIDHVVAASPDLDRSVAALRAAGLDLRRVREEPTPAGAPRQAFFRLGGEILELIQEPAEVVERAGGPDRPVRFWGLALLVDDLDRVAERMAPHVGEPRAAVQPGRRIATVRRSAGLAVPLALMSADERAKEER